MAEMKPAGVFTEYFEAAMRAAHYELLEENEGFWGEIPGLQGVWGAAETLEACRAELRSVLESWVLFGLRLGKELPEVDGVSLNLDLAAVEDDEPAEVEVA